MLVKIKSIAIIGVETAEVTVEVNVSNRGLPHFDIVGLPNKSVDESRYRVKTAFQNSGIDFPDKRITVNLAPADIAKEGSLYDLPIATGLLCAQLDIVPPENSLFFGEISLDGGIQHTYGSLLLALHAKGHNNMNLFIPNSCVNEASAVSGLKIFGVGSLNKLKEHLLGLNVLLPFTKNVTCNSSQSNITLAPPFCDIVGQEYVKRGMCICAAGGHNILLVGPPGSGKTLLARSIIDILPSLTEQESIEVTKIYTSVGKIPPDGGLITSRPFRSPHHTISYAGMIGGGSMPAPGEVSLAHRGVLFMDEFTEFDRQVLEALRQPLEDSVVTISRSKGSLTFPSKFILVASANPCPCGFYGLSLNRCTCTPKKVEEYQKKLSGPILDRLDLHVSVEPVEISKLSNSLNDKNVSTIKDLKININQAYQTQIKRFAKEGFVFNSEMNNSHIKKYCRLNSDVRDLLDIAAKKYDFSARAYFKSIKVARTIADLSESTEIDIKHMAEAVQYRTRLARC